LEGDLGPSLGARIKYLKKSQNRTAVGARSHSDSVTAQSPRDRIFTSSPRPQRMAIDLGRDHQPASLTRLRCAKDLSPVLGQKR
jgi:hypothetical protein